MTAGAKPIGADRFGPLAYARATAVVRDEWIDGNGHMNNSCYLMCAQDAYVEALKTWRGDLHDDIAAHYGNYTLQSLVTYRRELRAGAPLVIASRLHAVDARRNHVVSEIFHAEHGFCAALVERTAINVARGDPPRVVDYPPALRAKFEAIVAAQAGLPNAGDIAPMLALDARAKR